MAFFARKKQILADLAAEVNDKSPKGSIDAPITDLIAYINALPAYVRVDVVRSRLSLMLHPMQVTTSSCSGRIVLYKAPNPFESGEGKASGGQKGQGSWLLAQHATVDLASVCVALETEWLRRSAGGAAMVRTLQSPTTHLGTVHRSFAIAGVLQA